MNKWKLFFLFLLWNILHISFLSLNEVMKIADSFAYLQMAHHLGNFSLEGFWNGWFGFLYSLPIAITSLVLSNDMIASFVVNILFMNILVFLALQFAKEYLNPKYNILYGALLFLSPILLHYNIHILSENIYIPLFLITFILLVRLENTLTLGHSALIGIFIALLYYTRGEAFIYLGSLWIIYALLFLRKKLTLWQSITHFFIGVLTFFFSVLPYIFYLHSFTGEWGLTNKGSANLRQAELRWVNKMDDDGFEQAVWELRSDHKWLIAGFAGGLKYDAPEKGESFQNYVLKNPQKVGERILENQQKLYTNNLPRLISGDAYNLFFVPGSRLFYNNYLFLLLVCIPIYFLWYGFYVLAKQKHFHFISVCIGLFFTASIFFTLFFVLDRYFVVFVPIFLLVSVFGFQSWQLENRETLKFALGSIVLSGIFALWILSYYHTFRLEDAKYEVKKEAWLRLQEYRQGAFAKIMERFPVVTYYAGSKERWLTPYTDTLGHLITYAQYKDIDYLVVDSVDFEKYRPGLQYLLHHPKNYPWLKKLKEFEKNGQIVIIYEIIKKPKLNP